VVVMGVPALAVLAGCSTPSASPAGPAAPGQDAFFGYDDMVAEYRATLAELELPEGVRLEDEVTGVERSGSFQEGFGEVRAVMAWNCAWGREWLEHRDTDPASAAHALDMYARIVETDAFATNFDPQSAQPVIEGIIEKARLGDPTGVQQDVEANCPVS
jgi:hypothetical protein